MIVILKPQTTAVEVSALEAKLDQAGLESILSKGEGRDVLVVLGETRKKKDLRRELLASPGVERVVRILPERGHEHLLGRRSFLDRLLVGTGAVLGLILGGVVAGFLLKGGRKLRQVGILPVGPVKDFEKRPYRLVNFQDNAVIVVYTSASRFYALSATCTHSQICRVQWDASKQQFGCPCHRSAFDVHGNVLHGPPPRPLRSYGVKVINDEVYVRTIS